MRKTPGWRGWAAVAAVVAAALAVVFVPAARSPRSVAVPPLPQHHATAGRTAAVPEPSHPPELPGTAATLPRPTELPGTAATLPRPTELPGTAATLPRPTELPSRPPDASPPPALAADVPPPAPRQRPGEPPWVRFSVPAAPIDGRPRVAIIIDDLGLDKKRTERAIALTAPLTLSFLAYAGELQRQTEAARRAGHELLLHVPMEPMGRDNDMGPYGLATSFSREEVLRRLRWDLDRFDGYVGINNHMGSKFTSDARSMEPVIQELKTRGLLFVDSRTAPTSVGNTLAHSLGVPSAARDVFLDDEVSGPTIAARLADVEEVARRRGTAIAIGHPHDATLGQLTSWIAALSRKGLVLVPVSAIVRDRAPAG